MLRVGYIGIFILTIKLLGAQVGPPSLKCLSTSTNGDITLTWIPPADPGGLFFSYEIFHSSLQAGPYVSTGTVSPIGNSTFPHIGANGNAQSQYYYVRTRFGPGGVSTSANSDTLRSILLTFNGDGKVNLNYNQLRQPPLSTTSQNFTIQREHPVGTWVNLVNTNSLSYVDTISICTVPYNYQIVLGDNTGCSSVSNITGSVFHDLYGPFPTDIDSVSVLANGQTVIGYPASVSGDCAGYYIYQVINNINTKMDSLPGKNSTIYTYTSSAATNTSVVFIVAPFDSCGNPGILNSAHETMYLNQFYDKCKYQTQLNWNAYSGWSSKGGVSEYRIYYSVNGGNYQLLGSTSQTFYTHTGVNGSSTVSYFVRAFNSSKTITSSSNRVNFFTNQSPAPNFIYIRSVSVKDDNTIKVRLFVDSTKIGNGFDLYRSDDGSTFNKIAFITFNGSGNYEYTDPERKTREQSYFYKAVAKDSCGNDRITSSIVQSILLKVNDQKDNEFHKKLSWTNYTGFAGGIAGYNIYRVVNDIVPNSPSAYTNGALNEYIDNIEDMAPEGSKIEYIVSAVEGLGNPFGITETANSNLATTYIEADIFVPSAFSPKGVNKIWKPVSHFVDKNEYDLKVYNRWGNLLFSTNDDTQGWGGDGAPNDTYVYLINYKNARGEYIQVKGTFTLL